MGSNITCYKLLSQEEKLRKNISDDPIVNQVDLILHKALLLNASDIHLESLQDNLRVRYRIDGILYDQDSIDNNLKESVISRIKILSNLDISQKRIPQDGKLRVDFNNNIIDIRISSFPSIYGEKLVLRILDRSVNCLKLEQLGFSKQDLEKFNDLFIRPYGFFLVTGPTGAGKTTTLYAVLSSLNKPGFNIVTMEDPVEYNLDGITQSQINTKSGFTFKRGLRSILRQDPDIIMIGEIRDKYSAQIAIQASLTGHLVFSTLHTNDSVSVITRLIDMGIEPFLINASLSVVLAQRLARRLCQKCKKEENIGKQEKESLGSKNKKFLELKKIYKPVGCSDCFNLGYKGRIGIFEILVIDDNIRDFISKRASLEQILNYLNSQENSFLLDDGINKVKEGLISLEELLRVIVY